MALEISMTPKSLDFLGFPDYKVRTNGVVLSRKAGRGRKKRDYNKWIELKPSISEDGYSRVALCNGKRQKRYAVYRLVLLAFKGPCPLGMEACHNDGNSRNNNASNLRWDTRTNNMNDLVKHGKSTKGERSWSARLTEKQVLEIRKLYASNEWTQKNLADKFKVSPAAIQWIINRTSWTHI